MCLALVFTSACEKDRSWSDLEVDVSDAGVPTIQGHWVFKSSEVDVDLRVRTTDEGKRCTTSARLMIDEALASKERYYLEPISCNILELSSGGDIILYRAPTGHDWTREKLHVDTDKEVLKLGPWQDATSNTPTTYRFELSAPLCPDDDDCDCPFLLRTEDKKRSVLELGRRCD